MNESILKLAKECFAEWHGTDDVEFLKVIEAFYKAAYNKAIEDAAQKVEGNVAKCSPTGYTQEILIGNAVAIRELEMK